MTDTETPRFERLEYGDRFFIQTAKNAIESLGHVIAEACSNEDEAIRRRAERRSEPDAGFIRIAYDPDAMLLTVIGDGDGMTAEQMRSRLKRVGSAPQQDAKRGFFHRGIREVFLAMGGGEVTSIGLAEDGRELLSRALFDPKQGIALSEEDIEPSQDVRDELGLNAIGTCVRIPMDRFAKKKPNLYSFSKMEQQIRDCAGLRPVLTDEQREIWFEYGSEPARRLRFVYPQAETLVAPRVVDIAGQKGTFWVKVAEKSLGGGVSRQTRRSGILIRGERAAYEVTYGQKLGPDPVMRRIFGELRLDGIEKLQREADASAREESQLVYKTDRSGLNSEHPLVERIYGFLDETLGPLVADLDAAAEKKSVTPDMRRQLQKIARAINEVLKENIATDIAIPDGEQTERAEPIPDENEPPPPAPHRKRDVEDGISFARSKIFIDVGQSRTVEVWFDSATLPKGTPVLLDSPESEIVHAATLSGDAVPAAGSDGVAQLDLRLKAGNAEGRHEVTVKAGARSATLPVHVRFPRASGFISQIVPIDEDWGSGSAVWSPSTGVVKVYVGRPEFKDLAARAKAHGTTDPWKDPLYRQLVVESVREAALWEAAQGRAEVEWDELSLEERQETDAFHRLTKIQFQELDYALRAKLLKVFVEP
jgi:hypothetical protein